jgi:hypothetical protein
MKNQDAIQLVSEPDAMVVGSEASRLWMVEAPDIEAVLINAATVCLVEGSIEFFFCFHFSAGHQHA